MRSIACAAILVSLVIPGSFACNKGVPAGAAPPPRVTAVKPPAQNYDYTHGVRAKITSPRWAVAVLRFGDLAPEPTKTPPPPDTVEVDVKVGPGYPVQPPPQINKRGRDILKHALVQSNAFTVVERERIVELIREINFGQTDLVDPNTSPASGELIAVRYFIEGSLGLNEDPTLKGTIPSDTDIKELSNPGGLENLFDPTRGNTRNRATVFRDLRERTLRNAARRTFNVSCYISVYEVHTGAVVATVMGLGATGADAINDAAEELILELTRKRTEPRIAAVISQRVYLDVGESETKVGSTYDVIRQDTPIRDRNGQVIGYEETTVGQIEVIEVKGLMSHAKILRGASFARGQLCRSPKAGPPMTKP